MVAPEAGAEGTPEAWTMVPRPIMIPKRTRDITGLRSVRVRKDKHNISLFSDGNVSSEKRHTEMRGNRFTDVRNVAAA